MTNWFNGDWDSRFKITSDSSKVSASIKGLAYDLSNAPINFWNFVNEDGSDIRITRGDGTTLVARDVISIDTINETGLIRFDTGDISTEEDEDYYIYFWNESATEPSPSDMYGQYNAYDSDMVGYWGLEEGSGITASDRTNNENNGTITGGSWEKGKLGSCLRFSSSGNRIEVPFTSDFNVGSTDFSMSLWVNLFNVTSTQRFFWLGSGTTERINMFGGIQNQVAIRVNDSTSQEVRTSTGFANTDEWYLITAVKQGTVLSLYVNNSLIGTSSVNTSVSSINSNLIISTGLDNTNHYIRGFFDEARFVLAVYSANDVTTIYNNESDNSSFWTTGASEGLIFAIKGTVTLNGNPVEGADVRLINTTDDIYIGSFTTPADGTYSFTNLLEDKEYHALVQYKDGSNDKYNTLSLPFLSPEEVDDV